MALAGLESAFFSSAGSAVLKVTGADEKIRRGVEAVREGADAALTALGVYAAPDGLLGDIPLVDVPRLALPEFRTGAAGRGGIFEGSRARRGGECT